MKAVVEVRNVSMTYQSPNGEIHALENISFSVDEGEFISIIGPSGCGKTTLLSIISGLLKPTSGRFCYTESLIPALQKNRLYAAKTTFSNGGLFYKTCC